jgi:hypothetical protein
MERTGNVPEMRRGFPWPAPREIRGPRPVRRLRARGTLPAHPGGVEAPPGGHYEPPARSWLTTEALAFPKTSRRDNPMRGNWRGEAEGRTSPPRKARPDAGKKPRVERREASVLRQGRAMPRQAWIRLVRRAALRLPRTACRMFPICGRAKRGGKEKDP